MDKQLVIRVKDLRDRGYNINSLIKKIGRNSPCPCGSGAKFKNCCLAEIEKGMANEEMQM